MRFVLVIGLTVWPVVAEKLVSVPAGDRPVVVDLDSESVRPALRPASQEGHLRLPAYLSPGAGAAPLRAHYDTAIGIRYTVPRR